MNESLRMLASRRGLGSLALNGLAAFGLLSAVVQLIAAIWDFDRGLRHPWLVLLGIILLSVAWALVRAYPRRQVECRFRHPEMVVTLTVGDLFQQQAHLVVGFSDTFDTDTTDNLVINARSMQGQLLDRVYGGDLARLDRELEAALQHVAVHSEEPPEAKRHGKRGRYPIGTVAVLGPSTRRIFAAAYSRMGNDLIANADLDSLWLSLSRTWTAVRLHGQRQPVAVPIMGSEFARISNLDREHLLKLILLSFVACSRDRPIAPQLIAVIHPSDYERVNLLEVEAFLQAL
jgi:Domain of unknown function (DUF6430)